jgi:hypothetical protein
MDLELKDWVVIKKGTILSIDSAGKFIPCNGTAGTITTTYTVNDQNAGVRDQSGNAVVGGTSTCTRAASVWPLGVAPMDMFQNTKGRYNNYQLQSDTLPLLCERVVEVPYFTYVDSGATSEANATLLAASKTIAVAYGADDANADDFVAGDWVKPDANGNYVKWNTGDDVRLKVGQVLAVDTDFPKDMLEHVQTYPMSEMPGSETGGFPGHVSLVGATKALRVRLTF